MEVAILEMPTENVWRINLDGQRIAGHFKPDPHKEEWRYLVYPGDRDKPLRTEPHSREGAAMLLLFHHFEEERKRIEASRAT